MRKHQYVKDPENGPEWDGSYRCHCGMPYKHECHDIPDLSEEDVSSRIIGEADEYD